jgi:hypothetical protein
MLKWLFFLCHHSYLVIIEHKVTRRKAVALHPIISSLLVSSLPSHIEYRSVVPFLFVPFPSLRSPLFSSFLTLHYTTLHPTSLLLTYKTHTEYRSVVPGSEHIEHYRVEQSHTPSIL